MAAVLMGTHVETVLRRTKGNNPFYADCCLILIFFIIHKNAMVRVHVFHTYACLSSDQSEAGLLYEVVWCFMRGLLSLSCLC